MYYSFTKYRQSIVVYAFNKIVDNCFIIFNKLIFYGVIKGVVNFKLHRGFYCMRPWNVSVGHNFIAYHGVALTTEIEEAKLIIGNNVQLNSGVRIDYSGGVTIDDTALISEGVTIYTHSHGLDPRSTPSFTHLKIGFGAWIGSYVIITAGCSYIGRGAVIGSGAVVTKDVPDNSIVTGEAAKIRRQRFSVL